MAADCVNARGIVLGSLHLLLLLVLVSCSILAHGESVSNLVDEGNRAYLDGRYDEAIAAYEKAAAGEPESPRILFNKGTVSYRKGDFNAAQDLFEDAALKTRELDLEALCRYNIGNCSFREAQGQTGSDLKKAVEEYGKSIKHYQEALKLNPELRDAAHNIEVARLVVKDLLDQIKKQEEQMKQQQEQQKEITDKLKQLIDKQQEATEKSSELSKDKDQSQDPDQGAEKSDDLAKEQGEIKRDTEKLSDKMSQQLPPTQPDQQPSSMQQAKDHVNRAAVDQQAAEEMLKEGRPEDAHPAQEKAAEELEKALAALTNSSPQQNEQNQKEQDGQQQDQNDNQQQDKQDQQQASQQQQQDQQQQQEMTAQKPDETARDIIEEEKENRDRRVLLVPGGYQPVDKDW